MELSGRQTQKTPYLTLLQVVSAVAVVILHTNGCFWSFSNQHYWVTANIIECVCYFAVPVFFMITGATLINYQDRYSLGTFFKKRMEKTLIPYIAWSLIGLGYHVFFGTIALQEISLSFVLKGLREGSIVNIYWFFPLLFSVYLAMPLFASVDKEKRRVVFIYLLCVGLFLNVALPFISTVTQMQLSPPYPISVVSGYLIFVVGGALLNEWDPPIRIRIILYLTGIAGLLVHIIGTYHLSVTAGEIIQTYKGYCNLPAVVYSFAVFVLIRHLSPWIMRGTAEKVIRLIGRYTFSIYLMHWFLLDILRRILSIDSLSIIWRLGGVLLVLPIVILITWCLRKIPILEKIVP